MFIDTTNKDTIKIYINIYNKKETYIKTIIKKVYKAATESRPWLEVSS